MRKINKTCSLSVAYKQWEENLENSNTPHPKYTNTTTYRNYYLDIKMQLYYCQGGLCAYTEMRLCPEEYYNPTNWEEDKYRTNLPPGIGRGQLDHFYESLKSKKEDIEGRKDWLWDNFFMVDSDTNTVVKKALPVDPILKPDKEDYDPFQLLDYDTETHVFIPHPDLDEEDSNKVFNSINALGINEVSFLRRKSILREIKLVSLEETSFDNIEIDEYPTSFEMYRRKKGYQDSVDEVI